MQYKYVACKAGGDTVSGTLEADSEQKAEELLWQSDLTILSLKKMRALPSVSEMLPTFFGVKRGDVINFTRDLATLLGSGIGILPSLLMLYERTTKVSVKKLLRDLLVSVETGSTYSEACAKHPRVFSPFYIRLAKVGEEVGNLELMLRQITTQMSKEAAIVSKVKGAMAYPTFILAVAFVALGIMVGFVLPTISGLLAEIGGTPPLTTRILMNFSFFINDYWLYLVIGLVALILGGWLYFRSSRGKRTRDSLLLKIPVISDINIKGTMSRLARNLAVLLGGGISLTDSLDLIIQTTDNISLKETLEKVRSDVHSGQLLSQAMLNHPVFPPMLTQVVGVGEQTGRMEPNLEIVADFYEAETDKAITRATGMLGPAQVIFVGFIVGFLALALFGSIYGMAGQIGG